MSIKVELLRKYIREIIKQELKLQEASATGAIDGGEGPPKTPYAFQSKRKKDKEKEDKIAKQSGYSIAESINEITLGQMLAKQGKKIKMVKKPGGGFKMTFVPIDEPEPESEPVKEALSMMVKDRSGKKKQLSYGQVIEVDRKRYKTEGVMKMQVLVMKDSGNKKKVMSKAEMEDGLKKGTIELIDLGTVWQPEGIKNESITEGKYHDYRNDESLTAKQKIGYSMREVRDKLNELDKLVKMNVRLKNEVGVNSTDYWKNTHNAMKKISERLVKLANKVGQLY